jgi:hypothetical protein
MKKLDLLYRRRWLMLYVPVAVTAIVLLWLSFTQWMPLPPQRLVVAAGISSGGYSVLAEQYRKQLEQLGIQVTLVTSTQSHSPPSSLLGEGKADLAFANGLHAAPAQATSFRALAAIEREPLWVFTRQPTLQQLTDLRGLTIGVPNYDALQRRITSMVLQHTGLSEKDVKLKGYDRSSLANALIDGEVDIIILMGSVRNNIVRTLLRTQGVQLVGMDQVGMLLAREATLRPFVLPQGVIEFRGDIPSRDLTMVGSEIHLLADADMHPALQRAILQAASRIHELPIFLQQQGEYPTVTGLDFPVSETALAHTRGQRPWLEGLLPYRWAQMAQWLLYAALPILILTTFLLTWIPSWFAWQAQALLQNFYGELKFIETEIDSVASERPIVMRSMLQRLDDIELQVMQLQLPANHTDHWYTLRSHLSGAREKLLGLRAR